MFRFLDSSYIHPPAPLPGKLLTFLSLSILTSCTLERTPYNPSVAIQYAVTYCDEFARSSEDRIYFIRYTSANCNNFVSQVLLAGVTGATDMENIYHLKNDYSDNSGTWKWYYDHMWEAAGEWVFADSLFMYAQFNEGEGFKFEYISSGKPHLNVEQELLHSGDIVFMDWTSDGRMDHSMVITAMNNKKAFLSGHTKYHCNYPLDSVRNKYPYGSFYFFRPIAFYK